MTITLRHNYQWFDDELLVAKLQLRKLELINNQSGLTVDTQIFDAVAKKYHVDRNRTKSAYYNKCTADAAKNQATLFKIADKLLHSSSAPILPSYVPPEPLATGKVNTILASLSTPVPALISALF